MIDNDLFYIIVYPCGDQNKLAVAQLCEGTRYEINDYSVASRQEFKDEDKAYDYAKELAKKHNLYLDSSHRDSPDYLD